MGAWRKAKDGSWQYLYLDSVILGEVFERERWLYEAIAQVGEEQGVKARFIGRFRTLEAAQAAIEQATSGWGKGWGRKS